MKYNDTYSMIGAMLNQGFETEFKKERDKKEKRRRFFRQLINKIVRLMGRSGNISDKISGNAGKCRYDDSGHRVNSNNADIHTVGICTVDCCDRV